MHLSPIAGCAHHLSSGYAFHSFSMCASCHLAGYPHRQSLSSHVLSSGWVFSKCLLTLLVISSKVHSLTNLQMRFFASKFTPRCFLGALSLRWLLVVTIVAIPALTSHFCTLSLCQQLIIHWFFWCHIYWLGLIVKLISRSSCESRYCSDWVGIAGTESGSLLGVWLAHVSSRFICMCVSHYFPACTLHRSGSIIVDSSACAHAAASLLHWRTRFAVLCPCTPAAEIRTNGCCESGTVIPLFTDRCPADDISHMSSGCAESAW